MTCILLTAACSIKAAYKSHVVSSPPASNEQRWLITSAFDTVLKSAGVFPAPRPTVGLYGNTADLHRAQDPPRLLLEYTPGMMVVYHLKTCWPCLAFAASPTAGLFLISRHVYGRLHGRGQSGLAVCLFFSSLFFSMVVSSQISITKTVAHITDCFLFNFSSLDNGQSDYVHAQVLS